ncbi:hypothetical protein B0H34DRAFT_713234 [Crassisporium funariophilum]|nr:hypothetical protein B0H34DRAFT_713234 [Crassisporium funariophilum]
MDFVKKAVMDKVSKSGHGGSPAHAGDQTKPTGGKSDPLDKAIDMVQEHVLKQGSQKNESAAEQAKDQKLASGIRKLFKMLTGKNVPGSKK